MPGTYDAASQFPYPPLSQQLSAVQFSTLQSPVSDQTAFQSTEHSGFSDGEATAEIEGIDMRETFSELIRLALYTFLIEIF